jgi:hypothetical protein
MYMESRVRAIIYKDSVDSETKWYKIKDVHEVGIVDFVFMSRSA